MTAPLIPDYWTAQEALAVYEFIDMIRDEIWSRYEIQLIEILQVEHSADPSDWDAVENRDDPDDEICF